jgi:hypothetical protein
MVVDFSPRSDSRRPRILPMRCCGMVPVAAVSISIEEWDPLMIVGASSMVSAVQLNKYYGR